MSPRSGQGGFHSGRDDSGFRPVTLRERTRARAIALGLDQEWVCEGLGEPVTVVQCHGTTPTGDKGGFISVDASLGGADATLTMNQGGGPTGGAQLSANLTDFSFCFAGRVRAGVAFSATTDLRIGIASLAALAAPNGLQIGANGAMSMITAAGATTAVTFAPVLSVAFTFRIEQVASSGFFDLYINDVFQARRANFNVAGGAVPVAVAKKTASNDRWAVQALYCWSKSTP